MAGKRRRSNSRADDGAAGEHEDEDAAAPVGPTASGSEVQQRDFQPNPSQHKERAIPQYGGPQANAAAASQINPGDAASLGRAPLIRNDHLDPRGPAERQTSGDIGEGAHHADHPFAANGFPGATDTNSESPNIAEISIAAGAAGASSNPPAESLEIQLAKSQARAEVLREMLTAAQANFAPASGGGAGAAGGTGAAGGAVAGLAAASSDAERMIIVKTMLDPPDATLQTAMWAAARATPDIVSVEETKLRATYVAGGSTDEEFSFRFKLAQIRELYPPTPAMKYIGRNIISSHRLAQDISLPVAVVSWQDFISVRQMRQDEGISLAEADRRRGRQKAHSIGYGQGMTTMLSSAQTTVKLPDAPANWEEYSDMAERLLKFMVASNRWSSEEAAQVRDHMAHVQKLFKDYPAGDVVMYDENVRFLNDKFQRSNWGINNTQMQQDIHGPAAKRANLAETATALAASAAAAAAAGSPPWAPRKDSDRQVQASVRPFMKFQAHEGKNICMRWNWSIGDCTDDNCSNPAGLSHVCSFCKGPHAVKNCDSYKTAHPADFAIGYVPRFRPGGRGGRGGGRGRGRSRGR